jgi:nicotinamidase-related amidase
MSGGRIRLPRLPASPTVLLLIDFINPLDFEGADTLAPAAVQAARAAARLRRSLQRSGTQTVYANDNYGVWHADFQAVLARCSHGTGASAELARALPPRQRDFTVLKPRHSAFYATPLDLLLRQLACRRLVLAGLAADSCVLASAMDAYLRGYAVWVPADCVAAESAEIRDQALALMARVLKADVRPS